MPRSSLFFFLDLQLEARAPSLRDPGSSGTGMRVRGAP